MTNNSKPLSQLEMKIKHLIDSKTPAVIYNSAGNRLTGIVKWFDPTYTCVGLGRDNVIQPVVIAGGASILSAQEDKFLRDSRQSR